MFKNYLTQPVRRSRFGSLTGSAAIHAVIFLALLQLGSVVDSHLPRYTSTPLYLPPAKAVEATPPKVIPRPAVIAQLPQSLLASLPPPAPEKVPDLPAPPRLSSSPATSSSAAPLPFTPPAVSAPAPALSQPTAPTLPAPITGAFGSVPAATPSPTAKLPLAAGTFGNVAAEAARLNGAEPRSGPAVTASNGFGAAAAGISSNGPRSNPSRSSGGFATAAGISSSGPRSNPSRSSGGFATAVSADPVRKAAAARKPSFEPLEILEKPRPLYTGEARRAKIEGDVILEVLFSGSGGLRVVRVVRGLGYGLEQNAIDAATGIRFRPARENGQPVDTVATVRISFQIAY